MSSFRRQKDVLREAVGSYTNGVWAAGSRSALTTMTSVQAVVMGQDLQALPEGRHLSDFIKLYTSDRLKVIADGEGLQPDIIVHEEYGYELVSIFTNQSNVINHFKYIGVKVFKFTTTADWLSGALKRP
jgi:hypothetical protein